MVSLQQRTTTQYHQKWIEPIGRPQIGFIVISQADDKDIGSLEIM